MRASILLTAALFFTGGARADTIFFALDSTIKGVKFVPENSRYQGKYEALDFRYTLKSPRDIATGLAAGKRQHQALTLTKLVGESSPQLFSTLTTNDIIKTMVIDILRTNSKGEEVLAYSIRLTNAQISEINQYLESPDGPGPKHPAVSRGVAAYEDVSFVFQRIEVTSPAAKTSAMDDWYSQTQ